MSCGFFENVLANCVGALVTACVVKLVGQLDYVRRFDKNVEKLREKNGELKTEADRLQHEIENAQLKDNVQALQSEADKIVTDVQTLATEGEQNKMCLNWCPNWIQKYRLGKKATKKTSDILELLEKINKLGDGIRIAPPNMEFWCSEDFVRSKSSDVAFKQIIEALKDNNISTIGLWGMGGVGKTTLVHEVGKEAQKSKLFEKVVIITVSQEPDFEAIQDKIARYLGFDMNNGQGRRSVEELWQRLKKEKILIILDDVWAEINLKERLGIRLGDHSGCKILLTTRRQRICFAMDCLQVPLGCLDGEEAGTLFAKKAGLSDSSADAIKDLAKQIIEKCQGLPIAIVTLGSALKGKDDNGWKAAYWRLTNRQLTAIDDINQENAYLCLEVSFDYLDRMETKICFLLCSLFPEDYEIYVEDLVRFAWGLELYKDVYSIEDMRSLVFAAIGSLKDSCLLLDCGERHVKMHDLVRDVALWIASCRKGIPSMIKSEVAAKNLEDKCFEHFTAISFKTSQLAELPEGLDFPSLKILLLAGTYGAFMPTSSEFFEGMKALKVCALDRVSISPAAFKFQANLRTLHLKNCGLSDISILGKLKTLQVFSFRSYDITELPNEIGDLENLRLLELSNCEKLQRIPADLIVRLCKLEELYLDGCDSIKWATENATENATEEERYSSLSELNSLRKLVVLSLDISSGYLPKGFVFRKLQRFDVCIGIRRPERDPFWERDNENCPISRSLKIDAFALNACKQLFDDIESLELKKLVGYENLVPSLGLDQGGFNKLTSLDLQSCESMKCLIDSSMHQTSTTAFSKLVNLSLEDMVGLEELCNGLQPHGFLQKLKTLRIDNCKEMICAAPVLQNLQELEVKSCAKMQMLFQIAGLRSIEQGPSHHVQQGLNHRVSLQSLKEVEIDNCNSLKYLFPMSIANSLGQLETLTIESCSGLEEIIQAMDVSNIDLQSLREVRVVECNSLTSLFSLSHGQSLGNLTKLAIRDCKQLEYTFAMSMVKGENLPQFKGRDGNDIVLSLSSLQELKVENCPQLTALVPVAEIQVQQGLNHHVSLQSLKEVEIGNCNRLKYLFPMSIANSLGQLETLTIESCSGLEEIIQAMDVSNIDLQSLREVRVAECNSLTSLSSLSHGQSLENLTEIVIRDCKQLEYTFAMSMVEGLPKLNNILLKNLPQFKGRDGNDIVLSLSSLQELKVENCPQLTALVPVAEIQVQQGLNHRVSLQSLKEVEIDNCNSLKYLFPMSIANSLGQLETLTIESCSGLEEIIQAMDVSNIDLQSLREVRVVECNSLTSLFSLSHGQSLGNLTKLAIRDCKQLEYTFAMSMVKGENLPQFKGRDGNDIVLSLPSLQELVAKDCPQLTALVPLVEIHVQHGLNYHVSLQSLKKVEIYNCNSLKCLFPMSIANSLGQLEILMIESCSGLEEIIQAMDVSNIDLQSLREVRVVECNSLTSLSSLSHGQSLGNLTELVIRDCKQLEYTFPISMVKGLPKLNNILLKNLPQFKGRDGNDIVLTLPSLRELKVKNCKQLTALALLAEIQVQHGLNHHVSLQSLKKVEIYNCNSLKYLFPMSIANSLGQLETLMIERCSGLEEIIQAMDVSNIDLQSLREVHVVECNSLTSLSSLSHGQSLGNLTKLVIRDCKQLEYTFPISMVKGLPKLNNILLENLPEFKRRDGNDIVLSLPSLQELKAKDCPQLTALVPLVEIQVQQGLNLHLSFQNLKVVKIYGCNNLRYLFPMSVDSSLGQLEKLEIESCLGLEEIIQTTDMSNISLQSLREVRVEKCDNLTSLSSLSHGQSLKKLTTLQIRDCIQLEYTFPISMAEGLPQLNVVQLINLPQLKGKDGNDIVLTLPSLQTLGVVNCPQLTPFIISAKVQKLVFREMGEERKEMWNMRIPEVRGRSANMEYLAITNFEDLFDSGYNLSSMRSLWLQNLPELRMIWKGPIQVVNFQNLTNLNVTGCRRLRYIFSSTIASNLPQLSWLRISNCEELEQIIEKDQTSSQDLHHLQPICFPNLHSIKVDKCENLKYLFPITVAHGGLPKLEDINVEEASKLEKVFEEGDEGNVSNDKQKVILLSQLETLKLIKLPNLVSFSPVGYHFIFPSLFVLKVNDCPNITTSFSVDSERSVRAKTEARQSSVEIIVEESGTPQETTRPIGSDIDWKNYRRR